MLPRLDSAGEYALDAETVSHGFRCLQRMVPGRAGWGHRPRDAPGTSAEDDAWPIPTRSSVDSPEYFLPNRPTQGLGDVLRLTESRTNYPASATLGSVMTTTPRADKRNPLCSGSNTADFCGPIRVPLLPRLSAGSNSALRPGLSEDRRRRCGTGPQPSCILDRQSSRFSTRWGIGRDRSRP